MQKIIAFFSLLLLTGISWNAFGQVSWPESILNDSIHWDLTNARITDFLGRKALAGAVILKDVQFENGVIEADMAVTGARSYPGVVFRQVSSGDYERIYIRPHLPETFPNVLQYVASFNGIDSWQLYNGNGFTASARIPKNGWFHIRIEVMANRARVFINNSEEPSLTINDLAHGSRKGLIGLMGPVDGSAWFSNFSYRLDDNLNFPFIQPPDPPLGMITNWELSPVYKMSEVDMDKLPDKQGIQTEQWMKVHSLPSGLVDISRFYSRSGYTPDVVFARSTIYSGSDVIKQYAFGYSDLITIFLNGEPLFKGNSAYQQRDPTFQGIVGLNDYIFLPLKKGRNELLITLAESFGGWGVMFQDVDAIYKYPGLTEEWELRGKVKYPESVIYDQKRDVLYVSNLYNDGKEFISKIKPNGEIDKLEWAVDIVQPSGMCLANDKLYVVGRYALVEIDPETGAITRRMRFPEPGFPNDVAADEAGNLYVTDSQKNLILKYSDGKFEIWLQGDDIKNPNGILIMGAKMLVGTSGDGSIKDIDLKTKKISRLVSIGDGSIMDGLKSDGKGNWLISDYNGRIFRVTPAGEKMLLLDTRASGKSCADFEYIPEKKLLVIPTLTDNRIMTFKLNE